jgi:hypothetical protein
MLSLEIPRKAFSRESGVIVVTDSISAAIHNR